MGPVAENVEYNVVAQLKDYTFTASDSPSRNFIARKMASLAVTVVDGAGIAIPVGFKSVNGFLDQDFASIFRKFCSH